MGVDAKRVQSTGGAKDAVATDSPVFVKLSGTKSHPIKT